MDMNKKTVGMLFGATAGAIALRMAQESDPVVVPIVIGSDGRSLTTKPQIKVDLRFRQQILWEITNNSDDAVRVALENWRKPQGGRIVPAAYADGYDQPGLWRIVPGRGEATISAKGRLAQFIILPEQCEYDVYLNDVQVLDPIVKLVL
jgi:hypothetical protein